MKKQITLVESIVSYLLITILIGALILMLTSVNYMNSNQNRMHDEEKLVNLIEKLEDEVFTKGYEVKSQKGNSISIQVSNDIYNFQKNSFKKNNEELANGYVFNFKLTEKFLTLQFSLDDGDGETLNFFIEKPSTEELMLRK